jgi:CheY-like chemotaxis protein
MKTDSVVVVVEDEAPVADLIRLVIEDLGHYVLTAPNGKQGLELVRRERPRLVISDVMMPLMPGDELCRRIKATPDLKNVKVVLMSAAGSRRVEGAGADAFVHKPFDLEAFEDLVQAMLANGFGGRRGS